MKSVETPHALHAIREILNDGDDSMKRQIVIRLLPLIGCAMLASACGGSQSAGTTGNTVPAGGSTGGGAGSHLQFTGTLTGTFTDGAECVTGSTGLSVAVNGTLSDGKQYLFQILAGPSGTFTAAQGAQAKLVDLGAGGSFYGAITQTSDVTVQSGAQSGSVTATMPFFQDLTTPVPNKSVQVSGTWNCS